jgi:hypothetical protein
MGFVWIRCHVLGAQLMIIAALRRLSKKGAKGKATESIGRKKQRNLLVGTKMLLKRIEPTCRQL